MTETLITGLLTDIGTPVATILALALLLYRMLSHWIMPMWRENQIAYLRFVQSVQENNEQCTKTMEMHREDMRTHLTQVSEDSVSSLQEIRDLRRDLNTAFFRDTGT